MLACVISRSFTCKSIEEPADGKKRFCPCQHWEIAMRFIVLVVVLLLTETSLSFAQGHMGTPQEQQACSRDAQRFCRQQLGNDGAVQQCLQQNRTRLSKSCQKVFASHGMWRSFFGALSKHSPTGGSSPRAWLAWRVLWGLAWRLLRREHTKWAKNWVHQWLKNAKAAPAPGRGVNPVPTVTCTAC